MIEAYFGCECLDMDHIGRFIYFPPKENEYEDNIIYFTAKTRNIYDRMLPPFSFYLYDWGMYFHYHFLRRIPISIRHLLNPNHMEKDGIYDCFDFQNKDIIPIKNFLNNLTTETTEQKLQSVIYMNDEKWLLRFYIWRMDNNLPYSLSWDLHFIRRNLLGRIKDTLKYIFGKYCREQEFEINPKTAAQLKGMIDVVKRVNKN